MPVVESDSDTEKNLEIDVQGNISSTCRCPDMRAAVHGKAPTKVLAHLSDGKRDGCQCTSGDFLVIIANRRHEYHIDVLVEIEVDPRTWHCTEDSLPLRMKLLPVTCQSSDLLEDGTVQKIAEMQRLGQLPPGNVSKAIKGSRFAGFCRWMGKVLRVKSNPTVVGTVPVAVQVAYEVLNPKCPKRIKAIKNLVNNNQVDPSIFDAGLDAHGQNRVVNNL